MNSFLKIYVCFVILVSTYVNAGLLTFALESIDDVIKMASKVSGKVLSKSEKKVFIGVLRKAGMQYGKKGVFKATKLGGLELVKVAQKYGDDVWKFASKVPSGARVLALHPETLMPLIRKSGTAILEIEAKSPGLSKYVVKNFGKSAVNAFAKQIPKTDAIKLVGYARRAESPATKKLLFAEYLKHGSTFLNKLPAKHIIAGGLATSMIVVAVKTGNGIEDFSGKLGDGFKTVANNSPNTFADAVSKPINIIANKAFYILYFFFGGLSVITFIFYYRKKQIKFNLYKKVKENEN